MGLYRPLRVRGVGRMDFVVFIGNSQVAITTGPVRAAETGIGKAYKGTQGHNEECKDESEQGEATE